MTPQPSSCAAEAQVPSEHKPNEPHDPGEPDQTDEDERAWQDALLRARNEFAEEDTDVIGKQPSESAIEPVADEAVSAADSAPIELTRRRRRRTTRPHEPELPPQQVTVRRRRQTGTMSLATPAGEAGPPADLAPAALAPPAPEPPAHRPLPAAPAAPAPLDGSARARDRNRERDALERVLALAKPRTRQARPTPAVLPPRLPGDGPDKPDRE